MFGGTARWPIKNERADVPTSGGRRWAGRRPAWTWPDSLAWHLQRFAERLRQWALADVGPGRLVPWLAIAFGCGCILYFTADREPELVGGAFLSGR